MKLENTQLAFLVAAIVLAGCSSSQNESQAKTSNSSPDVIAEEKTFEMKMPEIDISLPKSPGVKLAQLNTEPSDIFDPKLNSRVMLKSEVSRQINDLNSCSGSYFSKCKELSEMAEQLTSKDIKHILLRLSKDISEYSSILPSRQSSKIFLLLDILIERDAADAITFVHQAFPERSRRVLTEKVGLRFAKQSPHLSYQHILKNKLKAYSLTEHTFKYLAKTENIDQLLLLWQGIDNSSSTVIKSNTRSVAVGIVKGIDDKQLLLDLYLELELNPDISHSAKSSFLQAWIEKYFHQVKDLIDGNAIEVSRYFYRSVISEVIRSASPQDLAVKADWLVAKNTGDKSEMVERIYEEILRANLRQKQIDNVAYIAVKWLDSNAGVDTQAIKLNSLSSLARLDVDLAIKQIDSFDSDDMRLQASFKLYQRLTISHRDKVDAFLNSSPYKKAIQEKFKSSEQRRQNFIRIKTRDS